MERQRIAGTRHRRRACFQLPRACISRNDKTPLAGFEQDDYVKYGPLAIALWPPWLTSSHRFGTPHCHSFARWMRRRGLVVAAASNHEVSVRALAYMIAGHELHHRRIFQEKYFPAKAS